MKIIGVDYEDGKAVGVDVLCEGDQRVHFVRASDVVDMIRCKDCKHWNNLYSWCQKFKGFPIGTTEEDYCSDGERKDDA